MSGCGAGLWAALAAGDVLRDKRSTAARSDLSRLRRTAVIPYIGIVARPRPSL